MTPDEEKTFLHYVFDVAWADGNLGQEEAEILATMLAGLELDEEEAARFQTWFTQPPPVPDWTLAETDRDFARQLVRQAMVMAGVDLAYSMEEIAYLGMLRERIGMSEETFQGIWKEVEEALARGLGTEENV